MSEIVGASASPLIAINGNARGSDGTATSGPSETANASATSGMRSPAPRLHLRAPYQSPPAALPAAWVAISAPPSSAAPWCEANAVIASSMAPTARPTPRAAPIRTRMLRERTGVTRLPSVPSCPRQAREAGDVAKIADPVSARATQTPSDAAGVATAITPAAISGPKMKAISMATASRAKAACLSSWSGTRPDQSVLIAFPVGRVPSPATVARAASATRGAPASAPPISPRKAAAFTSAAAAITGGWPTRSITLPCTGRDTAAAIE